MKNARISELRNGLSKYLDQVRHGETVVVYDRNIPIARIEPIGEAETGEPEWVREAQRRGIIRPARKPGSKVPMPPPKPSRPARLLEALLEERRTGR